MQVPPEAKLWQIVTGHFLPRCLQVVTELGVADHLDETPRSAAELAQASGAHADSLERALRLLATAGIFEAREGTWRHTELSRLLRSDAPTSMRAFARMIGDRINWACAGELGQTLHNGKPGSHLVVPEGLWAYYGQHPQEAAIFDAAMTAKSGAEIQALLPAVDFSPYRLIADVGGGRGHILDAVLAATPTAAGILFDLPQVVQRLAATPRRQLQAGDFFRDALPVADAYLLSNVLHDWDDEAALAIVRAVRRATPPHAELLVLEAILPEGPEPHLAKVLDLIMLTITGGRERSRGEYQSLLEAGGFRLARVIPTMSPVSVLVATPA